MQKITNNYTRKNIQKTLSKYKRLYSISPKKTNQKIFKNNNIPSLDSLLDRNDDILTNPNDMANEIYIRQTTINRPQVPTYYYQLDHGPNCSCNVFMA